jgi:hypothetical protein
VSSSSISRILLPLLMTLAVLVPVGFAQAPAPPLDPSTLTYKLPSQIKWTSDPIGAQTAVLAGDPSKPELYVMLVKWPPHHMSHPHWHPHNRFITVLSGVWWIGTGTKFDPNATVAMPAGSFVEHFARHAHYDGAKDEGCVIEIVGEVPATATPAESK